MKGFEVRENELGFTAVRLHYSADDDKDPATEKGLKWYESMRRAWPDPNRFAQEFEINWWVAAGQRVYPEFLEATHVKSPIQPSRRRIIYRAWDFGYLAPACLIAQVDDRDRLLLLYEVIGKEETTRQFAQKVITRCSTWFPNHSPGFKDFCDPAGQKRGSIATESHERSEIRDVEVLQTLGIHPSWEYGWSRKDGRALVHQLLQIRLDGTPGLYVDGPQCPTLIQGFLGKYVFPPKKGGQAHDEPDEDNHPWADVHAALRYLATGLYSTLGLRRQSRMPEPVTEPDYEGYGTPKRRPRR